MSFTRRIISNPGEGLTAEVDVGGRLVFVESATYAGGGSANLISVDSTSNGLQPAITGAKYQFLEPFSKILLTGGSDGGDVVLMISDDPCAGIGIPRIVSSGPVLSNIYLSSGETGSSAGPEHALFKFPVPSDKETLPWETNTTAWNDRLIYSYGSGTGIFHVRVTETGGYIFMRAGNFFLRRCDLDGSNVTTTSIQFDGGIGISEVNERIYLYNFGNSSITSYDYAMGDATVEYTKPGASSNLGGITVTNDGLRIIWAESDVGATSADYFYIAELADISGTKTQLGNISTSGGSALGGLRVHAHDDQDLILWGHSTSMYTTTMESAGSVNNLGSIGSAAVCFDRERDKILYSNGGGDIYQSDLDGNNSARILNLSVAYDSNSIHCAH